MTPGDHYYSRKPASPHRYHDFEVILRGKTYRFVTDSGVFSKERIDRGTRLLIQHMEIREGETVLDLGCGYGPIGVVAADMAYPGRVYLVDINERAVELSRVNIELNQIRNAEVRAGEGFAAGGDITFDVILSNPPIRAGKRVVYALVEEAALHLKRGGRLYMVARTRQGARSLSEEIERVFGNIEEAGKGGGYRVMKAIRQ